MVHGFSSSIQSAAICEAVALTKQRLLAEARSLVRCKREGVRVPAVLSAGWDAGWLVLGFVEGRTVRHGKETVINALVQDQRIPDCVEAHSHLI
jgi:tRNA A-37 threonylcarbamoyl transferase component Bud32